MKIHHFAPVLTLLLSLPAFGADTALPPLAKPGALATIDPKALKLLARVADKYSRIGYFATVVTVSYGDLKQREHSRLRLALAGGNMGVITKVDSQGTERWTSDGRVTRATATRRPKQYMQQPLNSSGAWKVDEQEFYGRAGFQGILEKFLVGQIGGWLLEPDLLSLTVGPTVENGATQKITVALSSSGNPDSGSVDFFVAEDLTLRRATVYERVDKQPDFSWDEIYSETVIANEVPDAVYKSIGLALPKGFKRVETFDPAPEAAAPVNNAIGPAATPAGGVPPRESPPKPPTKPPHP